MMSDIANASFNSEIIPGEIKIAKVIPIYKTGSKQQVSNYRPMSILPTFLKYSRK